MHFYVYYNVYIIIFNVYIIVFTLNQDVKR